MRENSPPIDPKTQDTSQKLCPSANPQQWDEGLIFGVVMGTSEQPRVTYLPRPQPATPEMLALASPAEPDEVFRVAGPCIEHKCRHFDGEQCGLVQQTGQILPVVTETPPPCRIRSQCQWWHQEGKGACLRCPQVVTFQPNLPREFQSLAYRKENNDV